MPSVLKQLIWSLSDFEFLASISSVDFHKRTINVKRHFWNVLIKKISQNVVLENKSDIYKVINAVKRLFEVRLGLVNAHSMKRFFQKQIRIAFKSFSSHLDSFFKTIHRNEAKVEEDKIVQRKKEKRRRHRENLRKKKSTINRTDKTFTTSNDMEVENPVDEQSEVGSNHTVTPWDSISLSGQIGESMTLQDQIDELNTMLEPGQGYPVDEGVSVQDTAHSVVSDSSEGSRYFSDVSNSQIHPATIATLQRQGVLPNKKRRREVEVIVSSPNRTGNQMTDEERNARLANCD